MNKSRVPGIGARSYHVYAYLVPFAREGRKNIPPSFRRGVRTRRRQMIRAGRKKCFRNPFDGTCYEEFILFFLHLHLSSSLRRLGNCAPPQDVVKSDGSLFPASIILVLDYPDSITRTFASVLRTAHGYIYIYMCVCIYIYVFASYISCNCYSSRGIGEHCGVPGRSLPRAVVKNRKKY